MFGLGRSVIRFWRSNLLIDIVKLLKTDCDSLFQNPSIQVHLKQLGLCCSSIVGQGECMTYVAV